MITSEARGAWNEIESRLRPYVSRRAASAADADDILQEIFVRMHRGLSSLRDEERFGSWVYRIAEHVIADLARARLRDPLGRTNDLPEALTASHAADGDDDGFQMALGECVALFVARLPSPYRETITLTELEGLTQKGAAEMLGISIPGVKSRIRRGREKIRGMFEESCQISVDCRGRVLECQPRAPEDVPVDYRKAAISWAARHG